MSSMSTIDPPTGSSWQVSASRRPWVGLSLLGISIVFTLSVLIFFGAWLSEDRIEARADDGDGTHGEVEGEWWEDGLIAVCPIH